MKLHTKQDFQNLMHTILDPLKPLYSKNCARLSLGDTGVTYGKDAIELEAFSRPLWALAPFWAGEGTDEGFEHIYLNGIINGTDPSSKEYWGGFNDYDQRFVEMAAIATAILLAPSKIWHPLSSTQKQNLASWLNGINEHFIPHCNWQFFMVLVNIALQKNGMPYNETRLQEGLAEIDSFYVGDGWYQDGASCQKDYYIPFAMHYYGLLYAKVMENDDPERASKYKERACLFAQDFIYWFSDNGAALPFGRSLTYRFAQCSFFSAAIFAGIQPFSLGVMKGIIARNLQWWYRQKMFDRDNVLTIGYAYPNLIMAERYNAPGSPYWGMKSFLLLTLADNHPFWQAELEELPLLSTIKPLYRADMLMHRTKNNVVAYAAGVCERYGHGHVPEKYSKFAYSTAFGFSCAKSSFVLHEAAPDSSLAFIIDDTVFVRKYSTKWQINEDNVYSEWSPFPGINVITTITPTQTGHLRRHIVESTFNCDAVDLGFSVPKFTAAYTEEITKTEATVKASSLSCTVKSTSPTATPEILNADPNTNILFPNTVIPCVRYSISKGTTTLCCEILAEVK